MSYHYNEAFENPAYRFSETPEVDRSRNYQENPFSYQNPYDSSSYSYQGEHRGRRQNYTPDIPMASLRHNSEYSDSLPRVEVLSRSGRSHDNLSFEPEPELAYNPQSSFSPLDDPYTRRFSSTSEDDFVRRRNRRPSDVTTFSTQSQATPVCGEEEKLVGSLASMSKHERIKAIQKMPENMKRKREIRNKVLREITKKSGGCGTLCGCCTHCMRRAKVSFRRFRNSLSEYFHRLNFWHKTLKIIAGEFGTSVLSYFIFLKWLLNFNIFSFLINFGFITVPQFVTAEPNNLSFTGLELLTGAGYFQQTVLYYGFYTNATIRQRKNGASYNMQLAYIFTVGIYFVICLLILLFSMAKSFHRNFINTQVYSGNASKLLYAWDFNITNEKAVKLKQKNLSTQIKEDLAEGKKEAPKLSVTERIVCILIHLGSWAASLGTAVAACAGVYFLSINNLQLFMKGYRNDLESQAAMLVLAIVTSLLNVVLPFFYSWLGNLEKFQDPKNKIYVTIARIIILKISIIGILCYYWLNVVAASESQCWETLVGQDIYRLVLVDFIFCLLGSFFGEFLRRIIGTTVCIRLGVPEFDIGRSVLDLIYAQTLTWIGILFSPLLPGIQMMSFSILFYVKKVSLMRNCQPPRKAWKAAQMTTFFMFLLFFPSLSGVLSVIAITVWRLKPSKECGPFRGLPSIYAAISEWVKILENYIDSKWVAWIYYNLITSELFFFILSVPILVITYLYCEIVKGRKTVAKLFLEQIRNEGRDKRFLLEQIRMLQRKQNPSAPRRQDQQRSSWLDHSSMPPVQQEPNYLGRTFDRNQNASYDEYPYSAGISRGTGFPSDWETSQPSSSSGMSEAVALALRARQAAQLEDLQDDINFRP
ncbi:transmembrane channel-like protein 5 isoform X1 [Gallus gallus]|uniref:transmembrane channel-like protein 5 isoform X1 n=1 Tax=Gallus gallus TaxID=9031 RepID=UPI001AEA168A|nr:transmembrane channel-like protein 5 isoform X1 [Gallus gallus]XP_040539953.1 transmembrane channel-like protein 5 isoform X1 [Gallus gallus]XP_040539954.1 transmembrane channel-like protein 5 isoform X1 [Gallus gallus]XP_040539956.1 transmembrane channel-like protein 5 isoform X1 [Gallus gallus]XP_046783598.1 transmembrane channel-like protein 5 isoform X1 [Gallus gallus]XP_046783599.1 transmembrane channel-like protein 5 isoform X1 [Gallus gallus]XP_046783600.1 transmembrane channel-like